MSAEPPIDVEAVLERTGIDVESLISLIEQTMPYLKERVESLCQAAIAGDAGQVAREAHAIKGSAGTLGMRHLHKLALRLEQLGKGITEGDTLAESGRLQAELPRVAERALSLGARLEGPDRA